MSEPHPHFLPNKNTLHLILMNSQKQRLDIGPRPYTMKARAVTTISTRQQQILLVDDECGVRESLAAVLTEEGFRVLPAANGAEALAIASARAVDLVILDLNMPVKNGWDTFERLSAENPLVPVIIATARPNQLFTALGAGVGALLEKPLDIPHLLTTIRRLLTESSEVRLRRLVGQGVPFDYRPSHAGTKNSPINPADTEP